MTPLTTTRTTEQVLSTEKRGLSVKVGQVAWSAVAVTLPCPSGLDDATTLALSQAFVMLMPHTGNEPIVKSLSVAVTDADDRVSDMKDAKQGGVPSSCVMLMPPSKKLNCGKIPDGPDFGVYAHGAWVGESFEMAQ